MDRALGCTVNADVVVGGSAVNAAMTPILMIVSIEANVRPMVIAMSDNGCIVYGRFHVMDRSLM